MTQQAPAGWYPQPDGTLRYWDGIQWTEHIAPGPQPAPTAPMQTPMTQPMHGAQPSKGPRNAKLVIIPVALLVAVIGLAVTFGEGGWERPAPQPTVAVSATESPEPSAQITREEPEKRPAPTTSATTTTLEEAEELAEAYLRSIPFSKKSLIFQLEHEGFSSEDAKLAVENIEVDWMEQAERQAEQYLHVTSLSREKVTITRKKVIERLELAGFTRKQAEHGAKSVGF